MDSGSYRTDDGGGIIIVETGGDWLYESKSLNEQGASQ
jgi:hypothetical protein